MPEFEGGESSYSIPKLKLLASPLLPRVHPSNSSELSNLSVEQVQRSAFKNSSNVRNEFDYSLVDRDLTCELPSFRRHEEATNHQLMHFAVEGSDTNFMQIELFYDLFFVANLTSFSSVHEINSKDSFTSYIGFFCVLWFTWCQVSLYDVRYVADSVVERIAKACHLGIMVGLAVVGPNFNPSEEGYKKSVFQSMSLILMSSRLILSIQYLLIMHHVRHYRNSKEPFAIIAAINFVAAMVYLGVTFAFTDSGHYVAYIAFYVLAIVEIGGNIAVSARWKATTFKGTHLVQRMSLLTLIILGEGVVVVCKNIASIVKNEKAWTSATIGVVISATATIYLLYMLYFDFLPKGHFGSIRSPIWTFLHFPFHLALVLFMEGLAEFVIWHKMVEAANDVINVVATNTENIPDNSTDFSQIAEIVNSTVASIWKQYPPTYTVTLEQAQAEIEAIAAGYNKTNVSSVYAWGNATSNLVYTVIHSVFTTYGFEAPEPTNGEELSSKGQLAADFKTVRLVFTYFFISAGITLLVMAVLHIMTIKPFTFKIGRIRLLAYFVFGLGICLVSTIAGKDAEVNLDESAWVLPIIAISTALVLLINHLRWPKRGKKNSGFSVRR